MKPALRRSFGWLLGAATLFAVAHVSVSARARAVLTAELPAGELTAADARAQRGAVLWIDARPRAEFARGHVAGAISLNEDEWESRIADVLQLWEPGRRVIVYCSETGCHASHRVAERLRRDYRLDDVWVLHGGWAAWQKAEAR